MANTLDRVLGIFAKWPTPGQVKTRLGGSPAWNAQVASAFLLDTRERLAQFPARRLIVFAPPEAHREFAEIAGNSFDLVPQSGADLGGRLTQFFTDQLATGARRVVVIGTDSPDLPIAF